MTKFKRTVSLLIVSIGISLGLAACHSGKYEKSDSVEQRIIFPQYSVVYDDETQNTTVTAVFSVNNPAGKSLCLSESSAINCNGETMYGKYDSEAKQYVYSHQFDEKFIDIILFEYTNNKGQIFRNDVAVNKFNLSVNQLTISKSANIAYINFNGKPLTDDETIELYLGSNDEMISLVSQGNRLVISGEQFNDIAEGVYDGIFVRTLLSSDIQSLDRGGSISAQYKTKKIKISITA